MKCKEYIFEGVPRAVWDEFKSAPSLGSYYNSHIRGRYAVDLRGATKLQEETEMRSSVGVLLLPILAFISPAWADTEYGRESLAGIRSVEVLVDSLDEPGATQIALPGEILTEVELKLRQAGLRVLPTKQMAPMTGFPYVHVSIGLMARSLGNNGEVTDYCYSVGVHVNQFVTLIRKPNAMLLATTWRSTGVYGYAGAQRTAAIREAIRGQVDEFLNAYLAANPKPSMVK